MAKALHWDGRHEEIECQPHIFGEQLWLQCRYESCGLDYLITDSPILLSLFYGGNRWRTPAFHDQVRACFGMFDNINVFVQRGDEYDLSGRQGPDNASEIDSMILNELCSRREGFLVVNHTNWKQVISEYLHAQEN